MQILIVALTIFQVLMLILAILLMLFVASILVYTILLKVPYVPTRKGNAKALFDLAGVKAGERVLDLGCGDGSILHYGAKHYGISGIGYDLNPVLIILGKVKGLFMGVSSRVKLCRKDFFSTEWPDVDVITIYLFPEINAKLEPLLLERYKGKRVISRAFALPNLEPSKVTYYKKEKFYRYEL